MAELKDGTEATTPKDAGAPPEEVMPLREIAGRTISGSAFSIASQAITLVLGLTRQVVLARLLMPEDFGALVLPLVFYRLITSLASLGLNAALVQRKTAEPLAVSTHFVMRSGLMLLGLLLTAPFVPLLRWVYPDRPSLVPILLALLGIALVDAVASTPTVLLKRRLAFRRLAVLDVSSSLFMLLVAPLLAWNGFGTWSLVLGELLAGVLVSTVGVWLFRSPWRLSLKFDRTIAREYLRFGRVVTINGQITYALDQFDDFWTATVLGSAAAGFYSKAYEFASYPRRVIARPLQPVFFSAYARLQTDRRRLSQAYYRLNSLVVRVGFLFSLVIVLVAPELVELLLTAKWLPMVDVFRLMVVYALLDPLIVTAGNLAVAMGQPDLLTRVKLLQLGVFVPAVIVFARLWGIGGVAVAADVMLLLGVVCVFSYVRRFVDFSIRRLFGFPVLALMLGGVAGWLAGVLFASASLWLVFLGKACFAGSVYVTVLMLFEHGEYRRNLLTILGLLGLTRGKLFRWLR